MYGGVRWISFGQQYTREQQDQILRVLNNSSEKELRKLSISPLNIMRILHHREENSGFTSMEHVGAIDGMQTRGLAKICEAILYGKKPLEKRPPDRGNSIIPQLTVERIATVTDIVAVDVQQVLSQLPAASLYVVEQKVQRHKGELGHSQSQLAAQAMLVALLSHGKQLQPQVISIKSSAITNLFDLNVGSERVSGQGTLKRLVDAGTISFQGNLRSTYFKETSMNREHFCGVLLLAKAFYMLAKT
ncbi:hypothetical protein HPB49_019419 [Dermacentor silvarum]|uniref:Uncharacterized protein n=1 Tax=Dermacentor silvarum TaxID=543639 RepID=A0ACB8C554_DERSI|nr:hypothetical protein HPB49_019419 [Dermacentor silvarum]